MTRSLALSLLFACGGHSSEAQPTAQPTALPSATATAVATPTATASAPPQETTELVSQPQGTVVVDRDVWSTAFEAALPVALCKNGSYFRACFTITQAECEQTAASATRVCLGKVRKQLPMKLHQPDEGTAWGSKIGSCAGTSYDAVLAPKKIHNAKCDDPSAWTTPP
jgi:hypothetical protein